VTDLAADPDRTPPPPRPVSPTTILAEELVQLCREFETMPAVSALQQARLRRARDLAVGLDPYAAACTTTESAALAELADHTAATDWAAQRAAGVGRLEQEMLSGHVEGQLLKLLVRISRARTVLEIGMFTGYSALAMAEALPAGGTVLACEIDPAVAATAQATFRRSAAGHKITVAVGPAMQTLQRLADEHDSAAGPSFDMVFIDADKPGYLGYVEFLLDGPLLAAEGFIAVDNTLLQGEPYLPAGERSPNGAAIAEFNAALTYDDRVEQVLLPVRDGITLLTRARPR
jgi:predicted O-methyltransferase YrrM